MIKKGEERGWFGTTTLQVYSPLVASVTPPFSDKVKQRVNVVFRQDDGSDKARVFVDAVPCR